MKSLKRILYIVTANLLIVIVMAGCVKTPTLAEVQTPVQTAKSTAKANKQQVILKYGLSVKAAEQDEQKALFAMAEKEIGIKVEPLILPDQNDSQVDKMLVSLMSGEEIDIIYRSDPQIRKYFDANVLSSLEEIARQANYDINKVYGKYLVKQSDGRIYGLPAFIDIWITLYNKKVFDDAKIPYPSAEGWTWNKYIETAKKLTDSSKGVYGSYMLDYDCYNFMLAAQKKIPYYKADGTSNFDDPAFAEALKFFYDLGNTEKIQPDYLTFRSKNLAWDGFTNGKYGMFVCGGWSTYLVSDKKSYPRDWKMGILPMPYPDGYNKTSLTVTGNYLIPSSSKYKAEAFQVIKTWAEKQYTLGHGKIPARVDIPYEELYDYLENGLLEPYKNDGITAEDFRAAWFDKNTEIVPEKIVGPGMTVISKAFVEEGELYGLGQIKLEEAIKAIKEKADKAIADEKAAKE